MSSSSENNNNTEITDYIIPEEAEARAAMLDKFYERVRQRIRDAGGMMKTTEQAAQEIAQEDEERYRTALDDMIATEEDDKNHVALEYWKTLSAPETAHQIDIVFANYIKKCRRLYGVGDGNEFEEMFKRIHHPDDLESLTS